MISTPQRTTSMQIYTYIINGQRQASVQQVSAGGSNDSVIQTKVAAFLLDVFHYNDN